MNKGSYIFFHTTLEGKKYITAYYVVDRVLDTVDACRDKSIRLKYNNPHIADYLKQGYPIHDDGDVIVFGDPISSRILEKPLLFDRSLAEKLSLSIKFPIKFSVNKSETQVIGSATRAWRELSDFDVNILLEEISNEQKQSNQTGLRSSEEVGETLERDIEFFIARNPTLVGRGLNLIGQQRDIDVGRLDLLFEDQQGNWIVVKVKLNKIGRRALQQIKTYIHSLRKEMDRKISGVIICSGVMPAYEDELRKQKDITIFVYGWDLRLQPW